MLPILRILPVGGVLLAILILILALTPPGEVRRALAPTVVAARGPLINRNEHPEWRQFLIRAALRRADALDRLRDLPDTPLRMEAITPVPSEPAATATPSQESVPPSDAPPVKAQDAPLIVADLPTEHPSADPGPDDITGTINELPGATMPIDIGETSSTELPVVLPEERPPVIRTPERVKARESRLKVLRRARHAKTQPKVQVFEAVNFFEALFASFNVRPPNSSRTINTVKTGNKSSIKRGAKATVKRGAQIGASKVAQEAPIPAPPPASVGSY